MLKSYLMNDDKVIMCLLCIGFHIFDDFGEKNDYLDKWSEKDFTSLWVTCILHKLSSPVLCLSFVVSVLGPRNQVR